MSDSINLFLGGGAARGIWQVGFLSQLWDKKILTKEFEIENVYAISAGNFAGLGLLYGDHPTLAHYWNSYDEENFPMFTRTKNLLPIFRWENSSSQLFFRAFRLLMDKKGNKHCCNFYSAVFNISKLTTEWLKSSHVDDNDVEKNFFASCSIPLFYSIKKINGYLYCDPGLFEEYLIKDFLNKHKGENNIILTTFDYPSLVLPEKSYHFSMPKKIKNKINFVENNKMIINHCYEESFDISKDFIEKLKFNSHSVIK